tara:strand:- start:115 stop:1014 length:900 start_codon:yes stop_codon:yes gene_type:complete
MDFKKKIYSKHKVSNIIGLILLLIILFILLESDFNLVNDSENDNKKSSTVSQSQTKINLFDEKKSFEYKKKNDLVLPNKDLNAQNPEEIDFLNKNTKKNKNIEKSKVKKKNNTLSLNLKTKKSDSLKSFEDPIMTVNYLHQGLKKISLNNNSNLEDILKVINQTYDAEKMLKMIIGKDWENQEIEKKEELIIVFKKYISKNYLKRFSKIDDVSFRNEKKEKISSELFLVRSNLIIKQEKISMDYLLSIKNNVWKIFDVLLDGSISEIATKKSEFRIFIKEKEIDSLIDALKKFNSQVLS